MTPPSGKRPIVIIALLAILLAVLLIPVPRATAAPRLVPLTKPPAVATEIPPEVLDGELYLTTDRSSRCRASLLAGDCSAAVPVSGPGRDVWDRSYLGVFGAATVRTPGGRRFRVLALHGENKNQVLDGRLQQNTVLPSVRASDCASGVQPGQAVYSDCWAAYSAFVTTSRAAPAVWPRAGYARGTTRLSHGVLHPSIVDGGDGFAYMTYYDTSTPAGFRVARSSNATPGRAWRAWVQSARRWVRSMPTRPGLGQRSPAQSTPLFASASSVLTITRTTTAFVSIEQGYDLDRPCPGSYYSHTRIRFSPDAHHWGPPIALHGPDFDGCDFYSRSRLTYPKLLNAASTSTKLIDPTNFQILGTQYGGTVWRCRVSIPRRSVVARVAC